MPRVLLAIAPSHLPQHLIPSLYHFPTSAASQPVETMSNNSDQNLVLFVREDGSYIPLTAAMEGDFTGLADRDTSAFDTAGFTITLRFEVNRPNLPRGCWCSLIPQWPGYPSRDFQAS